MLIVGILLIVFGLILLIFPRRGIWICMGLFAFLGWHLFWLPTSPMVNEVVHAFPPMQLEMPKSEVPCVRLDREAHRFVQIECSAR